VPGRQTRGSGTRRGRASPRARAPRSAAEGGIGKGRAPNRGGRGGGGVGSRVGGGGAPPMNGSIASGAGPHAAGRAGRGRARARRGGGGLQRALGKGRAPRTSWLKSPQRTSLRPPHGSCLCRITRTTASSRCSISADTCRGCIGQTAFVHRKV
jgi:hypothetical protein